MLRSIKKRHVIAFILLTFVSFIAIDIVFVSFNLYGQVDQPGHGAQKLAGLDTSVARAENQSPSSHEDINQIKQEKDSLTKEVESLRKYTRDLEESVVSMRQGSQRAEPLPMLPARQSAENDGFQSGAAGGSRDAAYASQPQVTPFGGSERAALVKEINELKAYVRQLETNIGIAKNAGFKFDSKETDFDKMQKEIDDLRKETLYLKELSRSLEAKLNLEKEANSKLEAKIEDYFKLVSLKDDLLAEVARLKRELQTAVGPAEFEKLKSDRNILAEENSRLKQVNDQLDSSISLKLKEASLRFESVLREHESALDDVKRMRAEKEDLARQLENIKKVNTELEMASRDAVELRLRLDTKTRELDDLRRQKDSLSSEATQLRLQSESMVKKEEVERLRIEKDALDRDLFNSRRRFNEAEGRVSEFSDANSRMKLKIEALESAVREKEGLLDQINSMKRRSGDLDREIAILREANVKLESRAGEIDKLSKERSDLFQEIDSLRKRVNELQSSSGVLTEENNKLQARAQDMDKAESEKRGLKGQLDDLNKRSSDLEVMVASLKEKNSSLESSIRMNGDVAKERDSLAAQASKLKNDMQALSNTGSEEIMRLRKDKDALEADLEKQKSYSRQLESAISMLKEEKAGNASKLANDRKSSDESLAKDYANINSERDALDDKARNLSREVESLTADVERLKKNVIVPSQSEELKNLKERNSRLEAQVKEQAVAVEENKLMARENRMLLDELAKLQAALKEKSVE